MANFVVYQNAKVHYTDTGKGEAVVLLHGFLENLSMWNDLVPYLTKNYRVICIDLLGHGASEGLNNTHPMHIMSEAVYSVIHSLDLRQIILIGHSMGGYVSLDFGITHFGYSAGSSKEKGCCLQKWSKTK